MSLGGNVARQTSEESLGAAGLLLHVDLLGNLREHYHYYHYHYHYHYRWRHRHRHRHRHRAATATVTATAPP